MKDTLFCSNFQLNIRGKLVSFDKPAVMGILNLTPDSFYVKSRVQSQSALIDIASKMVEEGASFIDIGGYSSRPGAEHISVEEECDRVQEAIESLRKQVDTYLSIDTFRSAVAEMALSNGAHLVNDISGGRLDSAIFDVAARYSAPYILMHMRGTPQNMTANNNYTQLLPEVIAEIQEQFNAARGAGVKDIIVDPGFGFSKDVNQNFELMHKLEMFHLLESPILVGISRKSMIYKTIKSDAAGSLNGTTVLNTYALNKGAAILRVHDVKEAVEAVKLVSAIHCAE